jgi:hypothetical protein
MATNYYHIINFIPGLEREEMLVGHEELANQLVQSGRFRIDAEEKINFARLYVPHFNISMMFSKRELYDPKLLPRTKQIIGSQFSSTYRGTTLEQVIDKHIEIMRKEVNKYIVISEEDELKLARLVVQAAHPSVIMLILLENTEVYVSHSYNIGDMLDIQNWRTSGTNSGMQSTDGRDTAVFISCGGDPLKPNENPQATSGDGWPAIARLLIIGGQEIGHYSDIMRDAKGRQFSRYSADLAATHAKKNVKLARRNDIIRDNELLKTLYSYGFGKWLEYTNNLKFFNINKRSGLVKINTRIMLAFHSMKVKFHISNSPLVFLKQFYVEEYPAIMIKALFEDMLFNLTPEADVYKRDDPEAEEAIACIEALARVPQQVNKWGRPATKAMMQDLYKIYYQEVIPGCIKTYENISHKKYYFNMKMEKSSLWYRIKKLFKKQTYPCRDI